MLANSLEQAGRQSAVSAVAGELLKPPEMWRDEVISRVQQHRARRRKRSDANGTLDLNFQEEMETCAPLPIEGGPDKQRAIARSEPKIIEFPRPSSLPFFSPGRGLEPEDLELAGPVLDGPRILDAPEPPAEQMDLLPAFADIQLESEQSRLSAVELPPQPAPLPYRIVAGLVDMLVVLFASLGFAVAFVTFADRLPQPRMTLLFGLMVFGALWLVYQYLFLAYASGTPGMQLAQLELCTFTGEPVPLRLRRWRAMASMLSAFALGLGFAWAFVDEDTLGWHDRMTQTHVRRAVVSN